MFLGGYGSGYPTGPFEQLYRCYPVSFIEKAHLENGDKVIMPPSALDRLSSLHIEYPMLFEVLNENMSRTSHCGVMEFIADEGMIYMPYWMMENLYLQEGDIVKVRSATLPKGSYVKLQPHSKDFLDISNPKAVLETTLRNFSCLTTGDNIMMSYNRKKYYIDIVETKPGKAISIIETDCEVDFAPPLDYKPPEPARPPPPPVLTPPPPPSGTPKEEPTETPEEPRFSAFTGAGRRLDGKTSRSSTASPRSDRAASSSGAGPSVSASVPGRSATVTLGGSSSSAAATAPPSQAPPVRRPSGKLIFGGQRNSNGTNANTKKPEPSAPKEEPPSAPAPEDPKFQAFTGKRYVLRD